MDSLIEDYRRLYEVIVRQRECLENNKIDKLMELTEEKKNILTKIVEAEDKLSPLQREQLHKETASYVAMIVKEDDKLRCLLHARDKELAQKVNCLTSTKGNLGRIRETYGKKFSSYPSIKGEG